MGWEAGARPTVPDWLFLFIFFNRLQAKGDQRTLPASESAWEGEGDANGRSLALFFSLGPKHNKSEILICPISSTSSSLIMVIY